MNGQTGPAEDGKILVIHFGQLGDVVLSLPALGAIRERFPRSHITILVGKVPDQVVRLLNVADDLIVVDRVQLRDGPKLTSIREVLRLAARVRGERFDLVIDLHSLSETNILAFISGAPQRLLANRESRSIDLLCNYRPAPPKEDKSKHLTDRYLDVLTSLGIKDADRTIAMNADPDDVISVREQLFAQASGPIIGLFPGAGNPSRCWPLDKFAELAYRLTELGLQAAVVLGPEESGLSNKVDELFPASATKIEGLSIPRFIAAASLMRAFVTNDTGAMHLAACAGAPIILLLDGRAPSTYLPLTDDLQVITAPSIDLIDPGDVVAAVLKTVGTEGGAANDKRPSP